MKKKTRSIVISAILLISVAAIGYIWISYGKKPIAAGAQTVVQDKNNQILLDGKVAADKTADLGFVLPAKITSITKKVGDEVKAGEVLAIEDNKDIKAQETSASAAAAATQSVYNQLQDSLKVQKLKLKDLEGNDRKIQKAQIDSAKDTIDAQQNSIAAAQANLSNIKAQLAKTVLVAPFDGILTRQDAEIGEISGPTVAPFLTIESKGPFTKIESYASDLDASKIKVGDKATVKFDTTDHKQTYNAHVVSVDPSASKDGAAFKVTLTLDQTVDFLKSGMHAGITIAQ